MHTLQFLIDGGRRLLIFGIFSNPPKLIRTPPFINFWKISQTPSRIFMLIQYISIEIPIFDLEKL